MTQSELFEVQSTKWRHRWKRLSKILPNLLEKMDPNTSHVLQTKLFSSSLQDSWLFPEFPFMKTFNEMKNGVKMKIDVHVLINLLVTPSSHCPFSFYEVTFPVWCWDLTTRKTSFQRTSNTPEELAKMKDEFGFWCLLPQRRQQLNLQMTQNNRRNSLK